MAGRKSVKKDVTAESKVQPIFVSVMPSPRKLKVLLATGDACESLEVMYPYQRMLEAGIDVVIAAPCRKTLHAVVHDFEPGIETYTEKPGYRIEAHAAFCDVVPDAFDGLILPGGRAPEYIRNDPALPGIVRHFFDVGKPVAAICHAALILIAVGVARGRTLTAYPALAPDVRTAGATFEDRDVVVDGNLITSRAWPDNPAWMREFLKRLKIC